MNNSKKYYLVLSLVIIGFTIDATLLVNAQRSVPHADSIPDSSTFSTAASLEGDISEKSLPKVYNLPPNINLSQTLKLRRFLYQFSSDHDLVSVADGYYREDSLYTNSGTIAILIDIPSVKQTLAITTMPNDTLDISCGLPIDQKETSWTCSNDSLGESE